MKAKRISSMWNSAVGRQEGDRECPKTVEQSWMGRDGREQRRLLLERPVNQPGDDAGGRG